MKNSLNGKEIKISGIVEVSEIIPRGFYFRFPRESKFKTESRHEFRDKEGKLLWWMLHDKNDDLQIPFVIGDLLKITVELIEKD